MIDPRALQHTTRSLEELSLNAWPSLETVHYDGWLLRFARGYTRRANSVNPIYESMLPLNEKIDDCEQIYAASGQSVVFKISPAAQPSDLDARLAERGYRHEAPTSVQVADLASVGDDFNHETVIASQLEPTWTANFCRLNAIDERHVPTMTQMLGSIAPSTGFATCRREGEAMAVGLAVRERDYVGLFDIVTAPGARNQGIGRRLVMGLLQWGRDSGATRAYLQVILTNAPALHLYGKLGFREAYRYWYRVKT
jgi:ribosomal protein S18 acetylase RimI-like enzyme